MTKYALLIGVVFLLSGSRAVAQAESEKESAEEVKQETVEAERKPAPVIKVVPTAKGKHAKPQKVASAKPRTSRPQGNRPARNVRPSARPARPGGGRN